VNTSIVQSFRLPMTLPSFNDIEAAARQRSRSYANAYAEMKAELQSSIVGYIQRARLRPLLPGIVVGFDWYERDRRRDPIDIRPACKFVIDALCERDRPNDRQARAGIIHCDGWHCIRGVTDTFDVDAVGAGVEVTIYGRPRVRRVPPPGWPFEGRA